jgi:hypothetical protein
MRRVAALLAALSLGSAPHVDTAVEARSQLEGDWEWCHSTNEVHVYSPHRDADSSAPRVDLCIRGSTMTGGDDWPCHATFRYRPSAWLKGIDVVFTHEDGSRVLLRGTYELKGDSLCLYLAGRGKARPDGDKHHVAERHFFRRVRR